jgi:hypothetical protein
MYLTRKTAVIAMAFLLTVISVVATTPRGVSTDETA